MKTLTKILIAAAGAGAAVWLLKRGGDDTESTTSSGVNEPVSDASENVVSQPGESSSNATSASESTSSPQKDIQIPDKYKPRKRGRHEIGLPLSWLWSSIKIEPQLPPINTGGDERYLRALKELAEGDVGAWETAYRSAVRLGRQEDARQLASYWGSPLEDGLPDEAPVLTGTGPLLWNEVVAAAAARDILLKNLNLATLVFESISNSGLRNEVLAYYVEVLSSLNDMLSQASADGLVSSLPGSQELAALAPKTYPNRTAMDLMSVAQEARELIELDEFMVEQPMQTSLAFAYGAEAARYFHEMACRAAQVASGSSLLSAFSYLSSCLMAEIQARGFAMRALEALDGVGGDGPASFVDGNIMIDGPLGLVTATRSNVGAPFDRDGWKGEEAIETAKDQRLLITSYMLRGRPVGPVEIGT